MSFRRRPEGLSTAAIATVAALFVFSSPFIAIAQTASPQEIAIARQTAQDGLTAYRAGQFDKALSLFEQAKALYPSAQILRMQGYSLLALENWEKAADAMDASLASEIGPLSADDRNDVVKQLVKATARLGMINISSTVPEAKLSVDGGAEQRLPLNKPLRMLAGKHSFIVRAPKHEDVSDEITLEADKTVDRTLDPTPKRVAVVASPPPSPPAPPPLRGAGGWSSMQRTIGITVGGAGIALGGATLITALVSAQIRGNVEADIAKHKENFGESCDKGGYGLCVFDRAVINNDADRADSLRDASVWMGISAGVLVAGGVVLVLFSVDGSASPSDKKAATGFVGAYERAAEAKQSFACGIAGASGLACTGTF